MSDLEFPLIENIASNKSYILNIVFSGILELPVELETFRFEANSGWSVKKFPDLDSETTLILVFAAPELIRSSNCIQDLAMHYPKSSMIGCSTAGEIFGAFVYDNSLSVAIVKFDKTSIKLAKVLLKSANQGFEAGQQISSQLVRDDLSGIFVLSDGLKINGTELADGLNSQINTKVIITGGLAADGENFKNTFTIYNGEILEDGVVAVGFYGDNIKIGHASKGGWDIFGPERLITRSKGNILYELDGKPALELYKEYLGEKAADLPASGLLFPLSIRKDSKETSRDTNHNMQDNKKLVRTILGVNEDDQSLIFAGDIPLGYRAQLMRANFDRLIASAGETGELALKLMLQDKKIDDPILAIGISCVGRRLLLGERIEEETELLLEMLPSNTQQMGFYSYGELSPYTQGACDLHNQTMTLTTICEI